MRRLLIAVLGLLSVSCPGDLTEALRIYGYTPVRPASTFWQPGALIYVRKWDPFEVGYICSAKQVMGEDYKPMQSPTLNADLARATRKAITFSTQFMDIISGDADLHNIKSVKMSLRNARLFEVNDSDIDGRAALVDRSCMRNVDRRRRQGYGITMISSALQADVVYTVQFDKSAKLDAQAQVATLQNLALKLGVEASALGSRTIEAKGLIWGIRDDQFLAHLLDPVHLEKVDRRKSRLIDETQMPTLTTGFEDLRRPSPLPLQDGSSYGQGSDASLNTVDSQDSVGAARRLGAGGPFPSRPRPGPARGPQAADPDLVELSDGQEDGLTEGQLSRGAYAHPVQDGGALQQPAVLPGPTEVVPFDTQTPFAQPAAATAPAEAPATAPAVAPAPAPVSTEAPLAVPATDGASPSSAGSSDATPPTPTQADPSSTGAPTGAPTPTDAATQPAGAATQSDAEGQFADAPEQAAPAESTAPAPASAPEPAAPAQTAAPAAGNVDGSNTQVSPAPAAAEVAEPAPAKRTKRPASRRGGSSRRNSIG